MVGSRTRSLRRAALVALTVVMTGASVISPVPAGAHASPDVALPSPAGRTAVTVVVRGCRVCTVQAVHYVPSESDRQWWSAIRKVGADRQVTFDVPSSRTRGMSFFVDAPWHGNDLVSAVMTARYQGRHVGERVTPAQAAAARRGEACWAGTTAPTAHVVMRVNRYPTLTTPEGNPTWHPRAWAVRGLETIPPMASAYKGSLGAQDAPACGPPVAGTTRAAAVGRDRASTTLTFQVPRCEGCRLRLGQWLAVTRRPWVTGEHVVRRGTVRFVVPRKRTHGMQVAITAPWDGETGYQTFAVFRYGSRRPGQRIGFATAHRQTEGSACWAGTNAAHRTLKIAARRIPVRAIISGNQVAGTLAWTPTQQQTWNPMRSIRRGVYGSEEATLCTRP